MQEVKLENNNSGLAIMINDYPDLLQMPEEDLKLLAARLELSISACVKKERETDCPP